MSGSGAAAAPDPVPGVPAATGPTRQVLVVGSYPPALTPGAAVTLEMVRALWHEGAEAVVSSPRTTAARFDVPVVGPLAGRRLTQLAAATGAHELVLCVERDFPVPVPVRFGAALEVVQRATISSLVRAVASFDRVTLVICGDTGVAEHLWAPLRAAADTVVVRNGGPGTAGVTVLGPQHAGNRDTARRIASRLAKRALGPSYAPARTTAARALHRARRALDR